MFKGKQIHADKNCEISRGLFNKGDSFVYSRGDMKNGKPTAFDVIISGSLDYIMMTDGYPVTTKTALENSPDVANSDVVIVAREDTEFICVHPGRSKLVCGGHVLLNKDDETDLLSIIDPAKNNRINFDKENNTFYIMVAKGSIERNGETFESGVLIESEDAEFNVVAVENHTIVIVFFVSGR